MNDLDVICAITDVCSIIVTQDDRIPETIVLKRLAFNGKQK